jgi:general stress protein 26
MIEQCGIAMVGSNGQGGYPSIKAMIKVEAEGLKTVWFSTNTSSTKVAQFLVDQRASVYFVNAIDYKGLMLFGEMAVLTDRESRQRVWRYGNEMYFPGGVDDPDYAVLRFTTVGGTYYHNLQNVTFTL